MAREEGAHRNFVCAVILICGNRLKSGQSVCVSLAVCVLRNLLCVCVCECVWCSDGFICGWINAIQSVVQIFNNHFFFCNHSCVAHWCSQWNWAHKNDSHSIYSNLIFSFMLQFTLCSVPYAVDWNWKIILMHETWGFCMENRKCEIQQKNRKEIKQNNQQLKLNNMVCICEGKKEIAESVWVSVCVCYYAYVFQFISIITKCFMHKCWMHSTDSVQQPRELSARISKRAIECWS